MKNDFVCTCDPPPNVRIAKGAMYGALRSIEPRLELAQDRRHAWPAGKNEFRVTFLDGDRGTWERVAAVLRGPWSWESACDVHFIFDQQPDADIRITFERGGSWSQLGTSSTGGARDPSMQLGWLDAATPQVELRRVVTHEFGHALGFIHEHQSPAARIPWNEAAVYEHYRAAGWTDNQIKANVLDGWTEAECTNFSAYDGQSIMAYWMAKEWVTDPAYAHPPNTMLSESDRQLAAQVYGPPGKPWQKTILPFVAKS